MKHTIKSILFLLFLFNFNNAFANNSIVFIDMNKVIRVSDIGVSIKKQFEKLNKSNLDNFQKIEQNLKKEEQDLISKKNVLSQEEFKKKSADLRKKVINYQSSRKVKADELNKKRVTATQNLFKKINPILTTYTKENNISLILDKRNVVIGNTTLDITDIIVDLLNKSNPKISLN